MLLLVVTFMVLLQDVVTRGGKFVFLYKRPGKRVIVNDFGHFIVAPNSIEASIQQSAVGTPPCHYASILYFPQNTDALDQQILVNVSVLA